ncbi:MAG: hypothetical protein FJ102_22430 [Deltaproteobacteria bacterium]|nr:hypothetical protein [Deltaproteobacteria bacterium]
MLAFLLVAAPALASSWPAGSTINPGLSADITKEGFDAVAELIPALLPPEIPIDTTGDSYAGVLDQCWLGGYAYEISNAKVEIEVNSASITPGEGVLDVNAELLVALNDASDPFGLYTMVECLEDTCYGYVNPFPVNVSTSMMLAIVDNGDGTRSLDATMGEIVVDYELDGANDIYLGECTIGDIEEVLNYVGISLYDLILSMVGGTLESTIADMGPELEAQIEEAFAAATIEQDIELGDATVHVLLQPSNVEITPAAARITMEGAFSGDAATCIESVDPGGSLRTDSELPDPDELPSGISSDYHLGLMVADDFANAALYSFWRSGLLCYTLDENGPVPLDTSMLNLLTDDAFAPLFGEPGPVTIVTRPLKSPEVNYTGEHDLGLKVEDLELDFYAELDGRQARMITLSLDADAGADLAFDDSTGNLEVAVDLSAENITPSVSYNEIEPAANDAVLEKFAGLFGTIIDSVAGDLLSSLAFALPNFSGIGLQSIDVAANGDASDWLGVYTWLGPVSYGDASSCGGCGGEDTGGSSGDCGGGCSGGTSCAVGPFAPWQVAMLAVLVARRRRG